MNSKKLPRFGSTNAFIFSVVLVLVSALMFATPTLADDGRTEMEVVSSSTTGSLDITVRSNGRQDVSIYAWTRGEDGETNRNATICKIPVHSTDKASNDGFAFVGSQACSIASYGFDFGEVLLKATRKISGGSFTWDSWWVTVNYHGIDGYSDDGGLEISHADSTSNGLVDVTVRSNGTQDVTVWGWTEDDAGNIFHKGIVCRIMVAAAD